MKFGRTRVLLAVLIILFAMFLLEKLNDPQEFIPTFPRKDMVAIDNPVFNGYQPGSSRVIGIEVEGQPRAYPLVILEWHGVVNDVIGETHIAVTYCVLSNSAAVYDRETQERLLTIGVSSFIYKNNIVLRDVETGTFWSQSTGEALKGPLIGTKLKTVPSSVMSWEDWLSIHPSSKLLDYPESNIEYGFGPYGDYLDSQDILYPAEYLDETIPSKEMVIGVQVNNHTRAYPYSTLQGNGVLNDEIDGRHVVITFYDGNAYAFFSENHSFSGDGRMVMNDDLGRSWSVINGTRRGVNGTLMEVLSSPTFTNSFWFSWLNFHPDTQLYGYSSRSISSRGFLERMWSPLLGISVSVLIIAVYYLRKRYRERRGANYQPSWVSFRWGYPYGMAGFFLFAFGIYDCFNCLLLSDIIILLFFTVSFFAISLYLIAESYLLRGVEGTFGGPSLVDFPRVFGRSLTREKVVFQESLTSRIGPIITATSFQMQNNVAVWIKDDWLFIGRKSKRNASMIAFIKELASKSLMKEEYETLEEE